MKILFRWLCVVLLGGSSARMLYSAQFKFPNQTLTVPDGFEVELVAAPHLVDRPVTADFDDQGRLYVTDSSGSNDKVDKQLEEKPHRIIRLEDSDGDGRFDKSIVFADKMMFPEGCLFYNGSVYVAAPPSIWKLTDTDGDGVADQREEWFKGKTVTGCANDLHGPSLGLDGWIYWCKGAFAQQTYERPGRPPFVTRAAHIFRARPDGTGLEPVLTGGMDNPVSVAFTPGGERILTGTFFVHPGGGQRDGLIHAIYGGVYGKDHDVIYDHKRTGDLMPIMTHHGPSASCFVLRYESAAFGEGYRDNLFACLFNLHKVMRHVLVPDGATYRTEDQDFLVSDNPDFHPTDLVEDADGSLLVVDTGGWYKICCPTSQLWKPDVLGAIYRVRRSGAPKVEDPRGLKIAWAEATPDVLAPLLGDPRIVVASRALQSLMRKGSASVPVLQSILDKVTAPRTRLQAVWALTGINAASARQAVRGALADPDPTVRQAAAHSISIWRDTAAVPELTKYLAQDNPQLARVAAEALGRIGDAAAIPALLTAAAGKTDRVLEHSLIYALIELNKPEPLRHSLAGPQEPASSAVTVSPAAQAAHDSGPLAPSARRAALIALDQMDSGELKPEVVTPLLTSTNAVLKQTALWIVSHHPEWAGTLAGFFRERLDASDLNAEDRAEIERQLGRFARETNIQQLLVDVALSSLPESRWTAVRAMGRANLKEVPSPWITGVIKILKGGDPKLIGAAISTVRAWTVPPETRSELSAALQAIAHSTSLPAQIRLDALAAVPGGLASVDPETFDFLRAHLDPRQPVLARGAAANVLAKAKLQPDQLALLADSFKEVGPLETPPLLSAFDKSTNEALGLKLVASLKQSPGLAGLRPEVLKPRLTNFPSTVQVEGEKLLALLNVDAAQQREHLDKVMNELPKGDIRRGQAVFNGQKGACSTCHAIGYLGGNIGPDLTKIGQVRTERDLLEAVVYPSASFVRSFEPLLVSTKEGDDYNGVVRKDAPDELVLATGPGAEVHIPRGDITEMRPGTVSVMPGGLEELLSRQELADLIAFLRATRW